jgi:hypothetical protein
MIVIVQEVRTVPTISIRGGGACIIKLLTAVMYSAS